MRAIFAEAVIALSLIPALAVSASAGGADRTRQLIKERCSLCHGAHGEGSTAIYPRLAHQNRAYLEKQLKNFRDGVRYSRIMSVQAKDLSDGEAAGLAAHFSSQPALSHRIPKSKRQLFEVGRYIFHNGDMWEDVPSCASCHGEKGQGNEKLPRLAGQHRRYVSTQLKYFKERKRTNDNAIMHTIAKNLKRLEREAVALYISGMNAGEENAAREKKEKK